MQAGSTVKKFRAVHESARERETFKYDPSVLTSIIQNDGNNLTPGSELTTSEDVILTALAQLGACQTGTSRSLISLFDQSYQHIIAEATPTIPLLPNLNPTEHGESLWLCGTAIRRADGVCESTLCSPEPITTEAGIHHGQLPMCVVPDLQSDSRFMYKPYCKPGSPARFYAAVPIRTQRGINIGVYCVMDEQPLFHWDERKNEILRNISQSIMKHLETRRSTASYRRAVRMSRGMGSFVEGDSTMSRWHFGPHQSAFEDNHKPEGILNSNQQSLQLKENSSNNDIDAEEFRFRCPSPRGTTMSNGTGLGGAEKPSTPPTSTTTEQPSARPQVSSNSSEDPSLSDRPAMDIFSKAANLIRESIEVEGCLFLDARITSVGGLSRVTNLNDSTQPQDNLSSHSSSDDCNASKSGEELLFSDILGFSTTGASSINMEKASSLHASIPEKFTSKLLRRYPKGKTFSFDANGELQSSDSSEDDRLSQTATNEDETGFRGNTRPMMNNSHPWHRRHEGSTILEIFPGARSVAFVPLWDAKKERWSAACFVYTYTPTRVFTVEGELSYLRAFGMLAMAEVSVIDTLIASKAKSDVLGSISHELRSPLHGVILGVELLSDTDLSVFQSNILHTIETCGRTLKDTIDHLLDFAKINHYKALVKNQKITDAHGPGSQSFKSTPFQNGLMSLYSNVRLDGLVEDVVESIFAGFNFQYASIAQIQKHRPKSMGADISANRRLDSLHAAEELGPSLTEQGNIRLHFGEVSIYLDVDSTCSWAFNTQTGAVRRIIMNLFGNSLKYTNRGTITIRLEQAPSGKKRPSKEQTVKLTVCDTGNGISEDYLRNDLFKPFLQENQLSPGTGLGLSIVKQIVSRLGGSISVESSLGVGTTISVSLPMRPVSLATYATTMSAEDRDFEEQLKGLRGLRVCLLGFDDESQTNSGSKYGLAQSVCRHWLDMQVVSESQDGQDTADLLLVSEQILPKFEDLHRSNAPVVVVCANALAAYHHSSTVADRKDKERVFEFISQPTGPRKLAKVFLIAFRQWLDHQTLSPRTDHAVSASTPEPRASGLPGFQSSIVNTPRQLVTPAETLPDVDKTKNISAVTNYFGSPQSTLLPAIEAPGSASGVDYSGASSTTKEDSMFLLVDDNHINLKILASYAKKLRRLYDMATNGQEAVDIYQTNPGKFSCIFMDISMPVMDGFEAAQKIRSYEHEKQLNPVLIFALTGLASISAQEEARGSGIDLFLTKPVRLKELGAILASKGLV